MSSVTYTAGTPCWVDLGSPDPDASDAYYAAVFRSGHPAVVDARGDVPPDLDSAVLTSP